LTGQPRNPFRELRIMGAGQFLRDLPAIASRIGEGDRAHAPAVVHRPIDQCHSVLIQLSGRRAEEPDDSDGFGTGDRLRGRAKTRRKGRSVPLDHGELLIHQQRRVDIRVAIARDKHPAATHHP
jgi:hypothetical protein